MPARKVSEEVFYADEAVVRLSRDDVATLKVEAVRTARRRSRICTHRTVEDTLHEMFIVHERGAYVRPHKHLGKAESMHILEGTVDLVLFDEHGAVTEVLPMGEYGSGRAFYHRMSDALYHTLLIRSAVLVFHEVTTGPFRREDSVFASWAPEDGDAAAVAAFVEGVESRVAGWKSGRKGSE